MRTGSNSSDIASSNRPVRQNAVLALLCGAQLLLAIDGTIVTVALPTIARSLQLSNENLQWLVTIYALTFGGFLMIGGRCGDLFGRRKMFVAGLLTFMVMSIVCGAAQNQAMLIAGRAAQGFGAAMASPAALSFLTGVFSEGYARNRALGIWAATGGTGAVAGNIIGGALIALSGWRLIFFVNVPICLLVVGLSFVYLPRTPRGPQQSLDLAGAVCITGGLGSLIYSFGQIEQFGLSARSSITALTLGVALVVAFVLVERRAANPLLPLGILSRPVVVGNVLAIFASLLVSGCYFFASLYTQQVLGFSALRAGLSFAPWAATIAVCAIVASRNIRRYGGRLISTVGFCFYSAGALFFLSTMDTSARYLSGLLPAFVLLGIGTGLCTVTNTIAAMSGVERRFQGVAAGLTNSSQRLGSSLGVALLATVATSHTNSLLRLHAPPAVAEVTGLRMGLVVAAAIGGLGAIVSVTLSPRRARSAEQPTASVSATTPALTEAS